MSYLHGKLMRSSAKKWLKDRIKTIKTSPDGAQLWLRDLGKNGYSHAEAVEEYAGKIVQESKAKLSPEEIYLLLHAIYAHDVGYRSDPSTHPKRSQEMVTNMPADFFIHDRSLAEAIGWLCAAHGLSDLDEVPTVFPVDILSRTEEFDLRFLSCLLVLADEMDQGYLRVFNTRGQDDSPRNEVYHIDVGTQIVKIKTKPTSKRQYDELATIADGVQSRLDSVHEIILRRGIMLEHVRLYPLMWIPHKGSTTESSRLQNHNASILLLLDRTTLGMDILQELRAQSRPTVTLPTMACDLNTARSVFDREYAGIVWVLGEDFVAGLPDEILSAVARNTQAGGGLILFPFVAWSFAQGINDILEEAVPVVFQGDWEEGARQKITLFEKHPISEGIRPFSMENTFEYLEVKQGCTTLVAADSGNPMLAIGAHGAGKVAYVNVSSHLCFEPRIMSSPWHESKQIRKLIVRTIDWSVCGT